MDRGKEHAFSIELKSKQNLRSVKLGNGENNQVCIEGFLGDLLDLKLVEESMLEVTGANGIFRLDITQAELTRHMKGLKVHHRSRGESN